MDYEGLKKYINEQNPSVAIKELQSGRGRTLPNIDPFKNELDPITHKIMDPVYRKDKWVNISDDDDQISEDEINEFGGKKGKKPVKVERIPLALQRIIVERAVSFAFGKPLLITADVEDGSVEADVLKAVKMVLRDAKTKSADRKVARTMFSTTEVAELWYPVEKKHSTYGFDSDFKLRMAIFSPMDGDKLYPYFDDYGNMAAFSREYLVELNDNKQHKFFETWTEEMHYKWELHENSWVLSEGEPIENPIGKIPIVYGCQDEVEWYVVEHLIERLEVLLSNFADTNDYHASPKIFVTGELRGFAEKGESGAIIEGEEGSKAEYLAWQQAPEAVKLEIETLLKMIYTLTQTPDISWDSVKGLNVSGVTLKMLFMDAHLKVQTKAEVFDEYMERRMSIIQSWLKEMNSNSDFMNACDNLLIDVALQPYMISDDSANVSTLMAATGQKAIMSRKTAIQNLGMVNDVEAEIALIADEENQYAVNDLLEQEPTE